MSFDTESQSNLNSQAHGVLRFEGLAVGNRVLFLPYMPGIYIAMQTSKDSLNNSAYPSDVES